jgi:hypothetical protein
VSDWDSGRARDEAVTSYGHRERCQLPAMRGCRILSLGALERRGGAIAGVKHGG